MTKYSVAVSNVTDTIWPKKLLVSQVALGAIIFAAGLAVGIVSMNESSDNSAALAEAYNVSLAHALAESLSSPLKKALLTGFHSTAKHNATKAVSPSSETMRTI